MSSSVERGNTLWSNMDISTSFRKRTNQTEEEPTFVTFPRKLYYNYHLKKFWFCSSNNKYNFALLKRHTGETKDILKRHLTVQLLNCTFSTQLERHKTASVQSE